MKGRKTMNNMPLEADTRILIDTNLKNLGWYFNGKNKNVFVEQPRTGAERKKLCGKRPDYVLYSKDSDTPLIVIEAKKPGERIDTALEQGIYYAKILEAPLVFATDGVFCKSFHTIGNTTPQLNGEDIDEFIREVLALKFLTKWDVNTVSPKVQYDRKELIKIFDEANNMLRGDGLRAGIERFGEFANILFLKLISESEQIKRENDIETAFDGACSWDSIKKIPASTRIDYINKTVYEKLNSLYKTEIFTPLTIRDESILKEIMGKLDPLTLTDVDSDVKGDAFEYFLKASTSSKNDLGEYFTPRHIVKTMVRLANPQIGEKIYDPFCGTGGFLIESFRHICNNMARTNTNLKTLKESTVFGNEITNTARITKMNMILAGDGHSNIHMIDSLANPVDGMGIYEDGKGQKYHRGFDVVLANMPYSQKTKHGSLYDLPTTNGDSICVQHCIKAINSTAENGRMALVVPEGFLFRKDLAKVREFMLKHCELQSIISLPQGVFLPYTGVKTNIIYATKVNQKTKAAKKRKDFWYFNVKSDGYTLDNHRRKLDNGSDLDKYQEYRKLDDNQRQNMLDLGFENIPLNKIKDNSYILVGSRYREQIINSKFEVKTFEQIATLTRGVTYPKTAQTTNITETIVLPADNIDLSGNLVLNKLIYLQDGSFINDEKKLRQGDIFICMSSGSKEHIGKVAYITNNTSFYAGGFMGIIRTYPSLCLSKWLYYYLRFSPMYRREIKTLTQGANINNISGTINLLKIPIPPLEVQRQIIDELDAYKRVMDGARVVIDNYMPNIHISPQWGTTAVGDLFISSQESVDPQAETGVINYIGLENIKSETGELTGNIATDILTIKSIKRKFKKGDILYGKLRPNLNKVLYAEFDGICSTDIIVLRPKSNDISAKFYSILMRGASFKNSILNGVSGGQLPRVDISYFLNTLIQAVSLDEQRALLAQIEAEQALIEPSKQLIKVFEKKIHDKVAELMGDEND